MSIKTNLHWSRRSLASVTSISTCQQGLMFQLPFLLLPDRYPRTHCGGVRPDPKWGFIERYASEHF